MAETKKTKKETTTEKAAEAEVKKPVAKKKTETTKPEGFAVVDVNSSQEKVSLGDIVEVNRLECTPGEKLKFDKVLLTHSDGKTTVGKPSVEKAYVEMEVLEQFRGEKVHIRTFKAKSRYRRHVGHRQDMTRLKVTDIKF